MEKSVRASTVSVTPLNAASCYLDHRWKGKTCEKVIYISLCALMFAKVCLDQAMTNHAVCDASPSLQRIFSLKAGTDYTKNIVVSLIQTKNSQAVQRTEGQLSISYQFPHDVYLDSKQLRKCCNLKL